MKLGVNVDHVATLRQARGERHPDPVEAALICQRAGANSVVMHLREDRRHIQDADIFHARRALSIRFNLEMALSDEIIDIALRLLPDQVTLVPEKRSERTTESGLNLFKNKKKLKRAISDFKKKKITTSLFIDPDAKQIHEAATQGVEAVELHTGAYAHEAACGIISKELGRIKYGVDLALKLGLVCHAGHGLDYKNTRPIRKIKGIEELNIGYSIVTRSLWVGLEKAVKEMLEIIR